MRVHACCAVSCAHDVVRRGHIILVAHLMRTAEEVGHVFIDVYPVEPPMSVRLLNELVFPVCTSNITCQYPHGVGDELVVTRNTGEARRMQSHHSLSN